MEGNILNLIERYPLFRGKIIIKKLWSVLITWDLSRCPQSLYYRGVLMRSPIVVVSYTRDFLSWHVIHMWIKQIKFLIWLCPLVDMWMKAQVMDNYNNYYL